MRGRRSSRRKASRPNVDEALVWDYRPREALNHSNTSAISRSRVPIVLTSSFGSTSSLHGRHRPRRINFCALRDEFRHPAIPRRRRSKLLASRQYIFNAPLMSGRSVAGLWAIGTAIAVTIVMAAVLLSPVEL